MADRAWTDQDHYPEVGTLEPTDLLPLGRMSAPPGERQRTISAETLAAELGGGGGPGPGPGNDGGDFAVQMGFSGIPGPGQRDIVLIHRTCELHEEDVLAWCEENPVASAEFIIRQNTSTAGTITFDTIGNATVSFTSSPIQYQAGYRVAIDAPSPADPNMSRILFALVFRVPDDDS